MHVHTQPTVLLKIDFESIFNLLRRDIFLRKVKSVFPGIYTIVRQYYSKCSNLYSILYKISSATGVQQGDVFRGRLFSLSINDMISNLTSELDSCYLDDGVIAGEAYAKVCHGHICICGKNVDPNGFHGLSCIRSAGRHPRHSHIIDLIKRACTAGGITAIRELQGLSRCDGRGTDGLSMLPW